MRRLIPALALCLLFSGCAAMDAVLDYPMSFFDEETGETVTAPLGDVIADSSDGVASVVGNALGGVNPLLGLLGAGGAAALLGGARRKKKAAAAAEEAPAPKAKKK
tara:strand:+ start:1324 stop:1641 length:318 start_codon:yes stop_codon:yes gene_type:complete